MHPVSFPYRHPPKWLVAVSLVASFVFANATFAAAFFGVAMAIHHPHRLLFALIALAAFGLVVAIGLRSIPRPCIKEGWTHLVRAEGFNVVGPGRVEVLRHGIRVGVTLLRSGATVVETRLTTGFCAVRRDHAELLSEPPGNSGNAFVDRLCAFAGDPERVRGLADDEQRLGPLLAVVHGWPGSMVHSGGIRLRTAYPIVVDLHRAVDDVVELALALQRSP